MNSPTMKKKTEGIESNENQMKEFTKISFEPD